MKLSSSGFTKKPAEKFFMRLVDGGIKRLVDVRLNNVSQLAGFSKKDDLHTPRKILDGGCLLCSEGKPQNCHLRLVAEYLKEHWHDVEIVHIS